MEKRLCVIAAACLAAVSCTTKGENEPQPSLEVSPTSLIFAAAAAPVQEVTVTAIGTDWEYELVGNASEWVSVTEDRTKGLLTVGVQDNPQAEQRTASLTVNAAGGSGIKVKDKTVTIVQQPSDTPVVYSITVEPASLTFEAEGAATQKVTVMTEGEGLTWRTEVDEAARGWLTVTEGEGQFAVAVSDNPDTVERAGNITVIPSEESGSPKVVRVVQKEKVIPPSLDIALSNGATPEEGFVFDYLGENQNYSIDVRAVNIDWDYRVEYDSAATDWITVRKNELSDRVGLMVLLNNKKNEAADPRSGRIVIYTGEEGIGPYEVKVTQTGKPEFQSTILENVEVGTVTGTRAIVYPNNDKRQLAYTEWNITLWGSGIEFVSKFGKYTGSGELLQLELATNPIEKNEEGIYVIPDGTYALAPNFDGKNEDGTSVVPEPFTVSGGERGLWNHPSTAKGTWYLRMQDDKYNGEEARITGGTLTVTGTGDGNYRLEWDFVSDAMYHTTGSYEGPLALEVVG